MPRDWKVIKAPEAFKVMYHNAISTPMGGWVPAGREGFIYFLFCVRRSPAFKLHRVSMLPWRITKAREQPTGFDIYLGAWFARWLDENGELPLFNELWGRPPTTAELYWLEEIRRDKRRYTRTPFDFSGKATERY